jgi:DNA helicase TIP49 (TBP-interacting protein)
MLFSSLLLHTKLQRKRRKSKLKKCMFKQVERLFSDVKKSVEYLKEYEKQFLA